MGIAVFRLLNPINPSMPVPNSQTAGGTGTAGIAAIVNDISYDALTCHGRRGSVAFERPVPLDNQYRSAPVYGATTITVSVTATDEGKWMAERRRVVDERGGGLNACARKDQDRPPLGRLANDGLLHTTETSVI